MQRGALAAQLSQFWAHSQGKAMVGTPQGDLDLSGGSCLQAIQRFVLCSAEGGDGAQGQGLKFGQK